MAASSPGLRFDGPRRSAHRSRWPGVDPIGPDAAPATLLGDRPDEGYPANTRIHQGGGLAARTPGCRQCTPRARPSAAVTDSRNVRRPEGAEGDGGRMGGYVLGFQEIDQTDVGMVGGKGAHLGELSRLEGVRVPAGFCVTTDAFRRIMAETPSIGDRLDRLSRLNPDGGEAIRMSAGRSAGPSKGSPSLTIWPPRSPARLPGSANTPRTPSGPAPRRRTCPPPPLPASRIPT